MLPDDYESSLVLAIDVGSSSVRANLFDAQARPVAGVGHQEVHTLHTAPNGAAEDNAQDLLERVNRVIDRTLDIAGGQAGRIAAVGIDTLASTLLGVDRQGRAITPVYTYADTRPRREVQLLRRDLDVAAVYQRTGCPQHTAYAPARLLWLRNAYPEVGHRVSRWVDLGAYLYGNWFRERDIPMSYSQASWWGLLDRSAKKWDEELLDYLQVAETSLPRLAPYTAAQQALSDTFARRWPALENVPFFLSVGDGVAANVGSGCLGAGRLALTIGTSGAMRLLLDEAPTEVTSGLWAYWLGDDHTLLGGSFNEGGNVYVWARESLQLPPLDQLEETLRSLPPDEHGLTVLPFLSGERSPGWSARATGTVLGLNTSTTPVQMLQALLESVSYRFGMVGELLQPFLATDAQVIASGGAIIRSEYWSQLMAEVLQRPVTICEEDEATSRGAAILALHGRGIWTGLDDVPAKLGRTFFPDQQRAMAYQEAARRQRQLYHAILGPGTELDFVQNWQVSGR